MTTVNQASGFNYSVADLVDIDGDGLPDRVVCDATVSPNQYLVQKNLGLQGTGGGSFGSQYTFGPTSTGGGNPSTSNPFPDAQRIRRIEHGQWAHPRSGWRRSA